ncbi:hypothetical protein Tco_1549760, partial [Tanacetum coccineum]
MILTRIRKTILTSNAQSSLSKSFINANTAQNLSSILNNPHNSLSDNSWSTWLYSSSTISQPPQHTDFTPTNSIKTLTNFTRSDFNPYVSSLSDHYSRFEDIRNHANVDNSENVKSLPDDDVMAGYPGRASLFESDVRGLTRLIPGPFRPFPGHPKCTHLA